MVNAEKLIFKSDITIVATIGYDAASDVGIYAKSYTTAGTASLTSDGPCPGDAAALARWTTAARSTNNHPIYLYSYWHGCRYSTTAGADTLNASQRSLMDTYAAAWVTGFSDGTVTHHRCGPNGHVATGRNIDTVIRHRDFPGG